MDCDCNIDLRSYLCKPVKEGRGLLLQRLLISLVHLKKDPLRYHPIFFAIVLENTVARRHEIWNQLAWQIRNLEEEESA